MWRVLLPAAAMAALVLPLHAAGLGGDPGCAVEEPDEPEPEVLDCLTIGAGPAGMVGHPCITSRTAHAPTRRAQHAYARAHSIIVYACPCAWLTTRSGAGRRAGRVGAPPDRGPASGPHGGGCVAAPAASLDGGGGAIPLCHFLTL